jgi:O-antigen/teichoic acid export membrane protein
MDSNLSQVSKEVAKGTLWSILGTLFFKLCSFFYVVLIARVVSQDDIGILYLCMSITGLLSFASEFGIVSAMVRYIPFFHGKNENKKIFDMINFSYLTVLLSIIITIIMFWQADTIADFYALPQLAGALRFFSIFLVVNSLNKIFSNVLAGFADIKSTQFGSNLQNFLKLAITLLLFYLYGTNLTNLVFGYVLSFILPTLLMFWLMKSRLSSIDLTGEGITRDELVKDIAPFGFLIMVLGSFSVLLGSVDKLVLGYLLNPNESASLIGIYSIASGLATMVMIFPPTIGAIFFPVVSRLFGKNDLDGIRSITETAQRWVLFITLPVAIVFLVFADDLLVLFYGDAYGYDMVGSGICHQFYYLHNFICSGCHEVC